jgi:hypothetical protein
LTGIFLKYYFQEIQSKCNKNPHLHCEKHSQKQISRRHLRLFTRLLPARAAGGASVESK